MNFKDFYNKHNTDRFFGIKISTPLGGFFTKVFFVVPIFTVTLSMLIWVIFKGLTTTDEDIAKQKEIRRAEIAQLKEERRVHNIKYTKSCITRGLWVYPKQSNYFASFDFRSDGTWEMNNIRMGNSYKGTWSVTAPYEVEITYTYSSRGRGTIPDNEKIEFGDLGCKTIEFGTTPYYRMGSF